jgi:hypothetical protein
VAHDLAGGGGLAPGAHPATAKGQEPASDHATSPPFSLVTPDTHFITKYVGYAAECTDAPLAAHELMSIGLLSSVAGPRVRFPVNWRPRGLPLTVWIHYVVDSAMGRKSTVQDVGVDLAREVLPATSFFEWEGSQQGLIQRLADIDGTPLLFPRDELSGLMAQVKQGGHLAGLPQTLIRAYDVRPLENVRTRKRKDAGGKAEPDTDRAVEPYLVLLAASTRDSLLEYVGTPDYLSGFMPRFLVYSGSADPKPSRRPSEAILTARRELVSHLRRIRERAAAIPGPLGVDDAVYEAAWGLEQQWTHTVKNTVVRSSVAGAIVKRLLESLYKVAALLALDRAKAYVTAEDYQQATAMGQRWLASALELAQAAAASRFEKQCALVLEVIGDDWTTMRTILRRHRWLRIKHLEDILAALEEQAEIDVEYPKSEKGLKPRKVRRRS